LKIVAAQVDIVRVSRCRQISSDCFFQEESETGKRLERLLPQIQLSDFPSENFRAADTPVRGRERTTTIVRTGPYGFSLNPIYLSFVLLVLGLSVWLNDLWSLVTLVPAIGFIVAIVVPREERFLERNFPEQYSRYKASVRRWV